MRFTSVLLPAFLAVALIPGRVDATSFFLNATLSPASEVPPTNSQGSGFGEVDVSDDHSSIFVTLFVTGLSGQVAAGTGIYGPAFPGSNGPLVDSLLVPFPSFTSGVLTGTFGINPTTLNQLLSGQLYFNVFTNQFFGGFQAAAVTTDSLTASPAGYGVPYCPPTPMPEIRGQIELAPEPATETLMGLGLVGMGFAMRRMRRVST